MKFLCDRCKTRYSIGDDRVRGKILKIRCKNCANVITVREGMSADEPGARSKTPTTLAPAASSMLPANGGGGALKAAFHSSMTTKPPAALEEEWYVSIDGEQEGPLSLAEAQRWVAGKPFDAELHCWSEGFDDWLPVDKVSHFRGLRKKPHVVAPPMPRVGGLSPRVAAVEEEPKPLFAATMASLEKSAPTAVPSLGPSLGPARAITPRPSATPSGGTPALQARTNGAASARVPTAAAPPIPAAARKPITSPGTSPGAKMPSFDVPDAPTQIEAPVFETETPVPFSSKAAANDAFVRAMASPSAKAAAGAAVKPAAAAKPVAAKPNIPLSALADSSDDDGFDDDDDSELSIGEVSRVVNLADLMRPTKPTRPPALLTPDPSRRPSGAIPLGARTGAVPKLSATGAVPRLGATGLVPRIDDLNAALPEVPLESAAPPHVAATHRRGLILLIGAATALLAGVIVMVVVFTSNDRVTNNSLAGGNEIDTTRPDDPMRQLGFPPLPGKGSDATTNPTRPTGPRRPNITTTNPRLPTELPGTGRLDSVEIETMAMRNSSGTQRCYMRSQKGADAILIGDVRRIDATLDIGADGAVKNVTLSAHSENNLGRCLTSTIKSWRFRTSPGGLYRLTLQFAKG